jgi:hypothetical protein
VVGASLKELVSRSIYLCQNAEYQMQAYMLGAPTPLRPGEVKLAGSLNVMPSAVARTWEYWRVRLKASGFWPAGVKEVGDAEAGGANGKKKRS